MGNFVVKYIPNVIILMLPKDLDINIDAFMTNDLEGEIDDISAEQGAREHLGTQLRQFPKTNGSLFPAHLNKGK